MGKPALTKCTIHLSYVLDLYETLVSLSWDQAKVVQDCRKAMQWVLVLLVHPTTQPFYGPVYRQFYMQVCYAQKQRSRSRKSFL